MPAPARFAPAAVATFLLVAVAAWPAAAFRLPVLTRQVRAVGCPAPTLAQPLDGVVAVRVDAAGSSATANSAGSCGGTSGREVVFRIDPAVSGTITARTTGGDTMLYARSGDCANGGELACNDDADGAAQGESQISFLVTAGTPVFLFVDFFVAVPPVVDLFLSGSAP